MNKIFVIIDGNAIIHRAYHALPPMTTKDGVMVNAVFGFASMLLKVMADLKPNYLAVSFDVAGKTFRDELYDKYKAKRVKAEQSLYDQIPLVYEVVKAFGIPIYTKEGFEADDIIGTITKKVRSQKSEVRSQIIVTGDMDMLQLIDEHTRVYELRKGLSDVVLFDIAKVKEKYGFGPERIVDYKALRGDASDNIPGVPGIGEKTATELIQKYGGIKEIYKKIRSQKSEVRSQIKPSVLKKLEEGEKYGRLSCKLAIIRRNAPGLKFSLHDCLMKAEDTGKAKELFKKFEFFSLLKRLPGGSPDGSPKEKRAAGGTKVKSEKRLAPVSADEFVRVMAHLKKQSVVYAKELIDGNDVLTGNFRGLVVLADGAPYFFDFSILYSGCKAEVLSLFGDEKMLWVGHDVKQLVKAVVVSGAEFAGRIFDVMVASYVINAGSRAHDLRSIVLRELQNDIPDFSDQASLFGGDPAQIADELKIIGHLHNLYEKKLDERQDTGLFREVEMRLIPVLADIELAGVAIDASALRELSKATRKDIERLTRRIWKEAGEEFNPASSIQLREVLFEKMKLPAEGVKKGKTGLSTAATELEKLRGLHPIIALIEEHRELFKLQNTYIGVLPALVNKKTGRIHTSFNQAVAATGRLSSSDPNLQNIPVRTELGRKIRDAFVARDGFSFLSADYSQIELRIVASMARDEKMIGIFERGEDIHRATAAAINKAPLSDVTREMRSAAKEVNFGVLYGMGAYGLASRTGISQAEAQDFIRKYFEEFSGVKAYLEQTLKFARETGYVETLFGRRRYIPELKADNYQLRSAGERMAINMPIQGTAADLIKMAMISVHDELKAQGPKLKAQIILQVHDELVLEVKKGLEEEVGEMVKDVMEHVVSLRVPIEAHVSWGKRWGELK